MHCLALPPSIPRFGIPRFGGNGERAAVRAAYKQQDATPIVVVDDNSDSEVEVTSGKRLIKREPGATWIFHNTDTVIVEHAPYVVVDTSDHTSPISEGVAQKAEDVIGGEACVRPNFGTRQGLSPLFWKSMENTKTEAAALTVAHDSAVAHEAAGTESPPVTGGMAAPPIPRASGLANEFPSSMEKTKTEAAALTVVHDYAVAHEAAGTGSPGTAPITGGMAAPPIPRASGLVNEFPITIHGFYMEGEMYINAEPDPSAIPQSTLACRLRSYPVHYTRSVDFLLPLAPMASSLQLGYTVQRPYLWRWTTPIVVCAILLLSAALAEINVPLSAYETVQEVTSCPNDTLPSLPMSNFIPSILRTPTASFTPQVLAVRDVIFLNGSIFNCTIVKAFDGPNKTPP
ncbi:hypothetical protein B0H14DRAFT_3427656 [Mycena olivaceomarginata]|nr:hypothetical protein B0H14DRAFT_3427656 [Mycena olivaceomarginata]